MTTHDYPPDAPSYLTGRHGMIERTVQALDASQQAIARLRYYAQNDGELEQVIREYDHTMAEALHIPVDRVPLHTGTTALRTEDEADFERLLDASSLGPRPTPTDRAHTDYDMARAAITLTLREIISGQHGEAVARLAELPRATASRIRPLLAELLHVLNEADVRRMARQETTP